MYLSDGYPQATARIRGESVVKKVYLSDGYPQATAPVVECDMPYRVYLSDGYPQATAEEPLRPRRRECT